MEQLPTSPSELLKYCKDKGIDYVDVRFTDMLGSDRPLKCFAVWGTLGSTARWPEGSSSTRALAHRSVNLDSAGMVRLP